MSVTKRRVDWKLSTPKRSDTGWRGDTQTCIYCTCPTCGYTTEEPAPAWRCRWCGDVMSGEWKEQA